jgi:hypothetical protein
LNWAFISTSSQVVAVSLSSAQQLGQLGDIRQHSDIRRDDAAVIAAQINAGGQRSVLKIACEHHASSIAATTSAAASRSRLSGLRLM